MNTYLKNNEVILEVKNISKSFNDKDVLKNVSITLKANEVVSLVGVSGIGKSTLFNIISGLIKPDTGSVILKGSEITGTTGHVSYMHQKDLLLPFKTIIDNVSLPLVIKGEKKKNARLKALEYFDLFGLKGYENKYANQLSGGMRQRAALLRTYLCSNDINLLDEPFSALDAITKSNMHRWYMDIAYKLKMSTIFITHDIDEAILLSDRIYIMTGSPGTIEHEVLIEEEKPRSSEFVTSEKFIAYKKNILNLIDKVI